MLAPLLGIAPVMMPTAVQAQTASEDGPQLETVTVTARKVAEDIQSTPVAVTAFSGAELEQRNYRDISDLAIDTPNLVIQRAGKTGASNDAVFIRGLGQADSSPLADPAVGVYVDGVYLARNVGNIVKLGDIQQIEVLRGPQGTLSGKNTIGGALTITLNRPTDEYQSSAEATIGSYNQYMGKVMVNVPLTDNLFFRASAFGNTQDGYISLINYPGRALGDDRTGLGRAELLWQARSDLTFSLAADASVSNSNGNPTVLTAAYPNALVPSLYNAQFSGDATCTTAAGQASNPACFGSGTLPKNIYASREVFYGRQGQVVPPRSSVAQVGGSFTGAWDIASDLTLKSITSYRYESDVEEENLGYFDHLLFQGTRNPNISKQLSQEFQLNGNSFDDRLTWVAGAYFFNEGIKSVNDALTPLAVTLPFNSYPIYSITTFKGGTTNWAGYGQATYSPVDWLHITGGLRWTEEKKTMAGLVVPSTLGQLYGRLATSKMTPLGSATADLTDDIHGYVSYSEGYRSGGFPARLAGNITALPTFGPEDIRTYEVGMKSEWFDHRLRANLAGFASHYSNIQEAGTNVVLNLPTTINAGTANLDGMEAELEALITDKLTVNGSVSWLEDKFSSINPTANDGGVPVTLNDRLPFAPKWKLAAAATYTQPFEDGSALIAQLDGNYTTRVIFSIGNQFHAQQGAVALLNANLTYELPNGKVDLSAGVRNLTDRTYFTNGFDDSRVNGVATNSLAPPREGFVTLRWHL